MNHERRDTAGRRRRDTLILPCLVASAGLHLLIVILNPAFQVVGYGVAGAAGAPSAPATQFTVLSLSPDGEAAIQVEALPQVTVVTPAPLSPGASADDVGRESGQPGGAETDRAPSVAERLRYNLRPFSPPVRETDSERAIREAGERVVRAGAELGPLPPNDVILPKGGGIRIPFGFGPPGPAQTVPAPPLPDSILRRDSIRAAVRAAARRDSLRAARADTVRMRNVAPRRPVVIPRVRPDTTAVHP